MVFNNSILLGAAGQGGAVAPFDSTLIGNSIWLEGERTTGQFAEGTWGSESNQDRWIFATWVHLLRVADATSTRSAFFGSGTAGNGIYLRFVNSPNTAILQVFTRDNAGNEGNIYTTGKFRDLTTWLHVIVDYDSANAVANDRVSLYVNGVRTGYTNGSRPGQNNHLNTNVSGQTFRVGSDVSTTADYRMKGYLAQTVFLDNKSIVNGDLATTDFLDTFTFGTNGSQIVPKADADIIALASAAGNNSFCLDYSNSSSGTTLVADASSKGNNLTTSTIATANQSLHSPSKVYATWNALDSALNGHNTDMSLSDGGTVTEDGNGAFCRSTFAIPEGLFSYRVTVDDSTSNQMFGVALDTATDRANGNTNHPNMYAVNTSNGGRNTNGSGSSAVSGYSWSDGDTMEVYVSRSGTTYKIWYGKNGTLLNNASGSQGDPSAGTNELFSFTHTGDVFFSADYTNPGTKKATTDFGQRGYSPAEDALTLSTPNLTAPTYQGIDYFDSTIYEGNGTGQRVGDFVPFTDAYTVDNSAMFEHDDARYLSRTIEAPSSSGGKKGTWSVWFKTANIDTDNVFFDNGTTATNRFSLNMDASGQIIFSHKSVTILKTSANFKGDGSWHNAVLKVDTSQGTASNRAAMFIDGVEITSFEEDRRDDSNFSQNDEIGYMDESATQFVGSYNGSSANQWDGYLAEVVFLDDQYLDASSFGQLDTSTNRWVNKSVSGLTFGNCGFYLEFEGNFSSTSLGNDAGKDSSGNGNHFAQGGTWATTDQFTDTPSKNFAVMNSGDQDSSTTTTLSEGNLKVSMGTAAGDGVRGTLSYNGKMYWEVELDSVSTNSGSDIGIATKNHNLALTSNDSSNTNAFLGVSSFDSNLKGFINSAALDTSYGGLGNNFGTAGKFLMFAVDINAGKFWAGYDGTFFNSGNPAAGTNDSGIDISAYDTWFPAISRIGSAGSEDFIFNFGQRSFAHTPPTGFSNLNQDNLDDTASKLTAWAWIKNRDATDSHVLIDRVRGVGVEVHTDGTTTTPETTNANTVQRFLQRGVQVGSDVQVNTANESYVLWQWLVGNSATTGSTNDSGSIDSSVIAADAGHFSVVSWTGNETLGATIGHGLGGTPEFIIAIARAENGENKPVYHKFMTSDNDHLKINDNNVQGTAGTTIWDVSAMSSTLIGLGAAVQSNSNNGMIAYCFRSVPGVCKVGKYIGNGDNDGPYVNLGFKPRWVMVRSLAGSRNWNILDTARNPTNIASPFVLLPNSTAVDTAGQIGAFDILANGFKPRDTAANSNASGETYIYLTMADLGGNGTLPPIYGR